MVKPTVTGLPTDEYGFMRPTIGSDKDVWGNDFTNEDPITAPSPGLNGNWTKTDALLKKMQAQIDALEQAAKVPVGGLYLSASDSDPATTLGYGTWEEYASGRALVGVGDAGGGLGQWFAGEELGAPTHSLTVDEIPSHNHLVGPLQIGTQGAGGHSHSLEGDYNFLGGQGAAGASGYDGGSNFERIASSPTTDTVEHHSHLVDIPEFYSSGAGGSMAHNNIQESIGVYVWRRTA